VDSVGTPESDLSQQIHFMEVVVLARPCMLCAEDRMGPCFADVVPCRRCATPFGVDVVGITELIALVGALVGGVAARQRKLEAERLNEQLRKINMQLRQQARAGTIYAPGLSYAPAASTMSVPTTSDGGSATQGQTQTLLKPQMSMDEEISPEQQRCRETMREGKRLLRNGQGAHGVVCLRAVAKAMHNRE
jgi:hypothetical protein